MIPSERLTTVVPPRPVALVLSAAPGPSSASGGRIYNPHQKHYLYY
ncbi:hypothetical protein ACLQ18_43165 [Streptomyces sp. DT193]